MQRIHADFAYLLHSKPYRDNSSLVYLLTRQHGKVSFMVNGMKNKNASKRALLQPCRRLQIDYELKTGLSKLTVIDAALQTAQPAITHFMLYQYVHELLLTVLPAQLPVPEIFAAYEDFLDTLNEMPNTALRFLEFSLIDAFGNLPELRQTQDTQQAINRDESYYFYPDAGVYQLPLPAMGKCFSGVQLQAFSHLYYYGQAVCTETLAQGAMPVSSYLIQQLLGDKPLKTRSIYKALQAYSGV